MEVRVAYVAEGVSYPYWKVVLCGDRAAVAEFPATGEGSENLVYHDDLVASLRESEGAPASGDEPLAGWLAVRGDDAVLYLHVLAGGLERVDPDAVGRALGGWCARNGVAALTVADYSRRAAPDNWELP